MKKKTLIIVLSVLSVVIMFLIGVAVGEKLFQKDDNTQDQTTEQDDGDSSDDSDSDEDEDEDENDDEDVDEDEDEDEDEIQYSNYNGEYLFAKIPESWSILEYEEGAGSDSLVSGLDYEGLTAIKIFDEDSNLIFWIKGVNGIGGTGGCEEYYKFEDFSEAHLDQIKDENDVIFGYDPTIVDLSSADYSEFDLFNVRTRRIDNILYFDLVDSNNFFESSCGFSMLFIQTDEELYGSDGINGGSYFFEFGQDLSDEDLEILDNVLDSAEIIKSL